MKFVQTDYHLANSLLHYDQKSHHHHINHHSLHHNHQKIPLTSFNLIISKLHLILFTMLDYNGILILNFTHAIILKTFLSNKLELHQFFQELPMASLDLFIIIKFQSTRFLLRIIHYFKFLF